MKEYLTLGFKNPKHLYKAFKMSRKQLFSYFAFIALIVTLSMASVLMAVMGNLSEDGREIAETLPTFEIADNQLVVDEGTESYVHQTDSFLLFFDPTDSIKVEEIDTNISRLNVPIGIGLMADQFYLNILGQGVPVSYEQLEGLDDAQFRDLMADMGQFSPVVIFFIFLTTYLASSLSLIYEWLIIALFANILKTLLRLPIPFRKVARMALVAVSVPIVVISLIEGFGFFLPFTFELTLGFSLYFLFTSLKNYKKSIRL